MSVLCFQNRSSVKKAVCVRHLCKNSSFLVRIITGGSSTWLGAEQPQLMSTPCTKLTAIWETGEILMWHTGNKAGNTQKIAQMQKKLKYCWCLSLVTFSHRLAAARCCSRRGFGKTELGVGVVFQAAKAAFLFDLRSGWPERLHRGTTVLQQCWRFLTADLPLRNARILITSRMPS